MNDHPLRLWQKLALAGRIGWMYVRIRRGMGHGDLAALVNRLERPAASAPLDRHPARLGRVVDRVLSPRLTGARCLHRALVLLALLRRGGIDAELVLGLPEGAVGHEAHAWVEVEGHDVGPPPGGTGFCVLARYRPGHAPSSAAPSGGASTGASDTRSRSAS